MVGETSSDPQALSRPATTSTISKGRFTRERVVCSGFEVKDFGPPGPGSLADVQVHSDVPAHVNRQWADSWMVFDGADAVQTRDGAEQRAGNPA
ncbi:hypothetical protein GCM10027456_54720 [Kineosporia babensis]